MHDLLARGLRRFAGGRCSLWRWKHPRRTRTLNQNRRRIDVVSEPSFLEDLEDIPLTELRRRRGLCEELDTELSYYRRLLHGRLDLLAFELRRRSGEEARSLMEALPEILADPDQPPREAMPRNLPIELPDMGPRRRAVDHALDDDFPTQLPSLSADELRRIETELIQIEQDISSQRRVVHDALDDILEELTRRYRDGSATVDELLPQG